MSETSTEHMLPSFVWCLVAFLGEQLSKCACVHVWVETSISFIFYPCVCMSDDELCECVVGQKQKN